MRSARLHLDLGGTWLRVRLLRPQGLFGRSAECALDARHRLDEAIASLERVLARLASDITAAGIRLQGTSLRVQLGMQYACVGLMRLAQGDGARLAPGTLKAYVDAWVQQTLHRDPAGHVVRWQVLRDPHHVLVSCVDGSTFAALQAFAEAHGLNFDSCVPAVVDAVRTAVQGPAHTLVWSEGAGEARDACVQLLRLEGGQLRGAWRGRVPAAASGKDLQLEGAIRRFQAHHGDAAGEVRRTHWPEPARETAAAA